MNIIEMVNGVRINEGPLYRGQRHTAYSNVLIKLISELDLQHRNSVTTTAPHLQPCMDGDFSWHMYGHRDN